MRCRPSVFVRETYLPGRERRLNVAEIACQRGIVLLYLFILSYWSGDILWKLHIPWPVVQGNRPITASDSGRFSRLCVAVGSDELLGSHSDH